MYECPQVTNYGTLPAGSRSQAGGVTVLDIESLSSWCVSPLALSFKPACTIMAE